MPTYPFEASLEELEANLDFFVEAVFSTLESEFLVVPKGEGFVEYSSFEAAFEELKRSTDGFRQFDPDQVEASVLEVPLVLVVLRTMLGFTPSEWAYVATQHSKITISQGYVRSLDRGIRIGPSRSLRADNPRIDALIRAACSLLIQSVPEVQPGRIHRLDKADTRDGLNSIRHLAAMGAPYPMLLYERFLGRPFAGHRDSVSELIGGGLEAAIEEQLATHSVSFRKTKRAEKLSGFDQAPDFIVPDEFAPQVVIEAKLTEDDGTARDKVARVQRLRALRDEQGKDYDVVACIAGRGFKVRREDMRRLLQATDGKVFTLATMHLLIENTRIREYRVR